MPDLDAPRPAGNGTGAVPPSRDVREALAGLGYGTEEIRDALRELPAGGDAGAAPARRAQGAWRSRRA